MPPRNAATDRFSRIDQAEVTARADEARTKRTPDTDRPAKARKPDKPKVQAVRKPNVDYARDGRLFCKLPQDLCDRLDYAVIAERGKRRPEATDKSILVEEALRLWMKQHGY